MSWKKHFRVVQVPNAPKSNSALPAGPQPSGSAASAKFSSYLPEVYAGHPSRLQRYMQYDDMDRDSVINSALDTIADFCTQSEEQNDQPFFINYSETANETEVKIINSAMQKWIRLNDFRSRLWWMFRQVLKNGDQFFIRDPETKVWEWVDHYNVELVKVDPHRGKKPTEYVIRNLDLNSIQKLGAVPASQTDFATNGSVPLAPFSRAPAGGGAGVSSPFTMPGGSSQGFNHTSDETFVVDAKHMVHLSLSVGMDANWPFGSSILESVFKTFKQKELLEDAVIIYRVQRAPERRIFKIDVGGMNPAMANAHVERIKNEIHQRRIPNRTGGGNSIMDAAYNPLSMMEDYFFAQTAEGRGSDVSTLPGGDLVGEIGDLQFFDKKLKSGLRIPQSYIAGSDEQVSYNDGKLGAAMIQEFQFNKYCMRMQNLLAPTFDKEFKQFLKDNGIQIDENLFDLQFNPPQNFSKWRQIELDAQQINVYSQIADNKRLSERFKFMRYLNLTEEELLENERLWKEENPNKVKAATGTDGGGGGGDAGLSSVGVRSDGGDMGDFGLDSDTEEIGDENGAGGGEGAAPEGGEAGGEAPVGEL